MSISNLIRQSDESEVSSKLLQLELLSTDETLNRIKFSVYTANVRIQDRIPQRYPRNSLSTLKFSSLI